MNAVICRMVLDTCKAQGTQGAKGLAFEHRARPQAGHRPPWPAPRPRLIPATPVMMRASTLALAAVGAETERVRD